MPAVAATGCQLPSKRPAPPRIFQGVTVDFFAADSELHGAKKSFAGEVVERAHVVERLVAAAMRGEHGDHVAAGRQRRLGVVAAAVDQDHDVVGAAAEMNSSPRPPLSRPPRRDTRRKRWCRRRRPSAAVRRTSSTPASS